MFASLPSVGVCADDGTGRTARTSPSTTATTWGAGGLTTRAASASGCRRTATPASPSMCCLGPARTAPPPSLSSWAFRN
eukprot:992290-Prorocentrum_minimum.AAC.1